MNTTETAQRRIELLRSPAPAPLLQEPLESLYRQCSVWLDMFDFWTDELKFFNNLVVKKMFQYVDDAEQSTLARALDGLAGSEIESLKAEIRKQEASLLKHICTPHNDESTLREIQTSLAKKMESADRRFRSLRLLILDFARIANDNFFQGNETLQIIYERRSVRKYTAEQVDRLTIQNILKAAGMAPSALNQQPWKFYVLTDRAKIVRYSQAVKQEVAKELPEVLAMLEGEQDPIFHGAPLVIFITGAANDEWVPIDIGLCAGNLMLAARSLGFDSCPVGLASYISRTAVYGELGIPEDEKIFLAIVIGKGAERPAMHERKAGTVRYIV